MDGERTLHLSRTAVCDIARAAGAHNVVSCSQAVCTPEHLVVALNQRREGTTPASGAASAAVDPVFVAVPWSAVDDPALRAGGTFALPPVIPLRHRGANAEVTCLQRLDSTTLMYSVGGCVGLVHDFSTLRGTNAAQTNRGKHGAVTKGGSARERQPLAIPSLPLHMPASAKVDFSVNPVTKEIASGGADRHVQISWLKRGSEDVPDLVRSIHVGEPLVSVRWLPGDSNVLSWLMSNGQFQMLDTRVGDRATGISHSTRIEENDKVLTHCFVGSGGGASATHTLFGCEGGKIIAYDLRRYAACATLLDPVVGNASTLLPLDPELMPNTSAAAANWMVLGPQGMSRWSSASCFAALSLPRVESSTIFPMQQQQQQQGGDSLSGNLQQCHFGLVLRRDAPLGPQLYLLSRAGVLSVVEQVSSDYVL